MIAKLLHVVVQPVFVLVDPDTLEVAAAPGVEPIPLPAALVGSLGELVEQARQQIESQTSGPTAIV